ncbi:MAG: hypothetical protein FWD68_20545 [Alphaproteobacteria bacterium]|nr:hypothetical protein [Alphaproteobacteria bacterium]
MPKSRPLLLLGILIATTLSAAGDELPHLWGEARLDALIRAYPDFLKGHDPTHIF